MYINDRTIVRENKMSFWKKTYFTLAVVAAVFLVVSLF